MLVILMVALANFIAGSVMGPQDQEEKKAKGFLGYDRQLISYLNYINPYNNYYIILTSGSDSRKLEPRLHSHRWSDAGFLFRFLRLFPGWNWNPGRSKCLWRSQSKSESQFSNI